MNDTDIDWNAVLTHLREQVNDLRWENTLLQGALSKAKQELEAARSDKKETE